MKHLFENHSKSRCPTIPVTYNVTSLGPERSNPQLVKTGMRPVPLCHGLMRRSIDIGSHFLGEIVSLKLASKEDTGQIHGEPIQSSDSEPIPVVGHPGTRPYVSAYL